MKTSDFHGTLFSDGHNGDEKMFETIAFYNRGAFVVFASLLVFTLYQQCRDVWRLKDWKGLGLTTEWVLVSFGNYLAFAIYSLSIESYYFAVFSAAASVFVGITLCGLFTLRKVERHNYIGAGIILVLCIVQLHSSLTWFVYTLTHVIGVIGFGYQALKFARSESRGVVTIGYLGMTQLLLWSSLTEALSNLNISVYVFAALNASICFGQVVVWFLTPKTVEEPLIPGWDEPVRMICEDGIERIVFLPETEPMGVRIL